MYIRATDLGLGACWINQLTKVNYPELKEFLKKSGLGEEYVVYGALAVGYTDETFTTKEKKNRIIVVR
jgi:nitroreductase